MDTRDFPARGAVAPVSGYRGVASGRPGDSARSAENDHREPWDVEPEDQLEGKAFK
jgi:hypothetical protein